MRVSKLGITELKLSAIGFGAWAIGGGDYKFGWGAQDDKESIAAIQRGVEKGINWIDTAPVYGMGHSEKLIGKAIKNLKEEVFISTKCGLKINKETEDLFFDLNEDSIRAEIEESLRNLDKEFIDLYQIHKPGSIEECEEAWYTLGKLIEEGKIRYAGVSGFSLEQLKRIHALRPVSFFQPGYSMLDRGIEDGVLDFCSKSNIGVVVHSPMFSGLLTGTFSRERAEKLPEDDVRRLLENFQDPYLEINLQLVEKLRAIAQRNQKFVAQLAIAWVLRRPEITSAIVGARRPAQIEETVAAGDWVLSQQDNAEIDSILNEHHDHLKQLKEKSPDS